MNYNDRIVVFIEVLNKNWERIFYSGISQYVYIRKRKGTFPLSFTDALRLISEKNYPQVHISFSESGTPSRDRDKISPNYRINYINKGVKSAEKVHCFILIGSDYDIDVSQHGGFNSSVKRLDSTIYDLNGFIEDNEHIKAFLFIYPKNTMHIDRTYPFNKSGSGYILFLKVIWIKLKKL